MKAYEYWNHPCADKGLNSYRMYGKYGYIMIAAKNCHDAMLEAARSTHRPDRASLEVWDGKQYIKA